MEKRETVWEFTQDNGDGSTSSILCDTKELAVIMAKIDQLCTGQEIYIDGVIDEISATPSIMTVDDVRYHAIDEYKYADKDDYDKYRAIIEELEKMK